MLKIAPNFLFKRNALYYLKRYQEALAACTQAIQRNEQDASAYRYKAYALKE